MIRRETWYFDKVGTENTPACLELLEKAVGLGFRHLVVASTTGDSGVQAARRLNLRPLSNACTIYRPLAGPGSPLTLATAAASSKIRPRPPPASSSRRPVSRAAGWARPRSP